MGVGEAGNPFGGRGEDDAVAGMAGADPTSPPWASRAAKVSIQPEPTEHHPRLPTLALSAHGRPRKRGMRSPQAAMRSRPEWLRLALQRAPDGLSTA
ncbi:hypothetical protein GCM10009743_23480 [Kribbella swartbergensis]